MTGTSYLVLALVLLALVGGALMARWIRRAMLMGRLARSRRRGRQGEREAPRVLAKAGYRVLSEQTEREASVTIDGQEHRYFVRADLVVERDGVTYVAEVKTGGKAPDPLHSATRRQLLEYRVLYDAEGVLLVDMEAERVLRVEWPDLTCPPKVRGKAAMSGVLLIGLAVGLALGLIVGLLLAQRS